MKIAINAVRVSAQGGSGFDTYIVNLINELGKLTDDIDVYTIYPWQFPGVNKNNIKRIKLPFVSLKNTAASQPAIYTQAFAGNGMKPRIIKIIKKVINPDMIRMLWTQLVFPFRLVFNKYGMVVSMTQLDAVLLCPVKQAVFVYDLIPFLFPQDKHKHKFYLNNMLPGILKRAVKIVAISENTKSDLIKLLDIESNKIDVVYPANKLKNTVIGETEKNEFRRKYRLNKYILFVGSSHPHKNLISLVKSLPGVFRNYPGIELAVSGFMDGENFGIIEDALNESGIKDKVRFLGHLPDNEIPALYSSAEMLVFPTLYEGFGLPPLESMSFGCPVIISNTSSLPEVAGDAGIYVPSGESRAIADAMLKILSDNKYKQELIRRGYAQIKKFSWQDSAVKLKEILQLN